MKSMLNKPVLDMSFKGNFSNTTVFKTDLAVNALLICALSRSSRNRVTPRKCTVSILENPCLLLPMLYISEAMFVHFSIRFVENFVNVFSRGNGANA
jgi:hypothetical protein